MKKRKIAVIVPFFQNERGILISSVRSVLRQNVPQGAQIHVFIIDDESPVAADDELRGIRGVDGISYSVHRQKNTGPAGARNLGLQLAEDGDFDWIAFLDSDDDWRECHLMEACSALDEGFDFYFCDHHRVDNHESHHEEVDFLKGFGNKIREKSCHLKIKDGAMGFSPLSLLEEMFVEYACQTSTVVLRSSFCRGMRFNENLRTAGEDHLFWIELTTSGAKIYISWRNNVRCGRGLNLFFKDLKRGTRESIYRSGHQFLFSLYARDIQNKRGISIGRLSQIYKERRFDYSMQLIRSLVNFKLPPSEPLLYIVKRNPFFIIYIFYDALRYIFLNLGRYQA